VDDSIEGSPNVPDAVTLLVPPSAELRGTIRNAAGTPQAGELLHVWKAGGQGAGPAVGKDVTSEFVIRELPRSWDSRADANGAFRFATLPAGVKLTGSWFRGRLPPVKHDHEPVLLAPGEVRHIHLVTPPTGSVRGLVVDAHGNPVAGASVKARVTRGAATIGFRDWGRSDAQGRFTLTDVPAGKGTVVIRPGSKSPTWMDDFAAVEVPFAVTRQGELVECTVVVHPGLAICGTVVDPAGVPLAGVLVALAGGMRDLSGGYPDSGPHVRSGAGGTFRLAPVTPGEHTLVARGRGLCGDSRPVKAEAGASNVRLKLTEACAIDGEVVGGTPPVATPACISLWPCEGGGTTRSTYTDTSGGFRLHTLAPGAYDLVARCRDGRIGFLFGLRLTAGQPCHGLRVYLRPGGKLQLDGESLVENLHIEWGGHTVYRDDVCHPAVSVAIAVPAGRVRVRGVARRKGGEATVPIDCTVDIIAGKTAGLDLTPAR